MKIALTITTPEVERAVPVALLEGTFKGKLEAAVQLGYDGVELMTARPETLEPAVLRVQIERAGIQVAAISSGAQASLEKVTLLASDSEARERAFQRLEALIDFAEGVGAPIVTIGSFRGRAGEDAEQGRVRLVEILRRGARLAGERGIRLVIEPLNRYETDLIFNVGEGLALIQEVGEDALGLLFDTYHANIEEASLYESIRFSAGAGQLWHVHLADSNRLPPGQGHLDFPGILSELEAVGYRGFCSAELLAKPDPVTAAEKTIAYWKRIYRAATKGN